MYQKWSSDALFAQGINFYLGKKLWFRETGRTGCSVVVEGRLTNDSMAIKVYAKASSRRLVELNKASLGGGLRTATA
jgi:hypothetical protein